MQPKTFIKYTAFVVLCLAVGGISSLATRESVGDWYTTLIRPPLNPPSWAFGVVWPILYVLMGIAAGIVWNKGRAQSAVQTALIFFAVQLVLNGLWSPLFFGLYRIDLALADLILLWIMIAITTVVFYRQSRPAGLLLLPYLGWITFAVYLNSGYWVLNR